jgi:hypothetical protein
VSVKVFFPAAMAGVAGSAVKKKIRSNAKAAAGDAAAVVFLSDLFRWGVARCDVLRCDLAHNA